MKMRSLERYAPAVFIAPGVLLLAMLVLYPFIYSLIVSFQKWYLPIEASRRFVGFANYKHFLRLSGNRC